MKAKQIILGMFSILFSANLAYGVQVGDELKQFEAMQYNKGQVGFKELQSKVTIVNFWATWCESCKVEIKEMQTLFKPLLADPAFNVMFVSLDTRPEKAEQWFLENLPGGAQFTQYLYKDPEMKMAHQYDLQSFPTTFMIGKDGKIVHISSGYAAGKGQTEELVSLAKKNLSIIK